MLNFSHSGTLGDILSSLPAIKYSGGGNLYIHLNNTTEENRLNENDISFLRPLILQTGYIKEFRSLCSNDGINVDLDNFRNYFEKTHFASLIGLHFLAIGKHDFFENKTLQKQVYLHPFLKIPGVKKIQGKYVGVTRTTRHRDGSPDNHYFWQRMVDDGLDEVGVFFGLPEEHEEFEKTFNTKITYVPTNNALTLAEYIGGLECFVCSSTMAYWIATGLQKTTILETRQVYFDKPHKFSENECNNHRPHAIFMPFNNYLIENEN